MLSSALIGFVQVKSKQGFDLVAERAISLCSDDAFAFDHVGSSLADDESWCAADALFLSFRHVTLDIIQVFIAVDTLAEWFDIDADLLRILDDVFRLQFILVLEEQFSQLPELVLFGSAVCCLRCGHSFFMKAQGHVEHNPAYLAGVNVALFKLVKSGGCKAATERTLVVGKFNNSYFCICIA